MPQWQVQAGAGSSNDVHVQALVAGTGVFQEQQPVQSLSQQQKHLSLQQQQHGQWSPQQQQQQQQVDWAGSPSEPMGVGSAERKRNHEAVLPGELYHLHVCQHLLVRLLQSARFSG